MTMEKAKTPLKTHLSGGTRGWNRVHYNLSKIQFLTFSGSKLVALYCQKTANLKWNSKFLNLMDSPSTFGPPSQEMVSTPSDPEPAREAQSCQWEYSQICFFYLFFRVWAVGSWGDTTDQSFAKYINLASSFTTFLVNIVPASVPDLGGRASPTLGSKRGTSQEFQVLSPIQIYDFYNLRFRPDVYIIWSSSKRRWKSPGVDGDAGHSMGLNQTELV